MFQEKTYSYIICNFLKKKIKDRGVKSQQYMPHALGLLFLSETRCQHPEKAPALETDTTPRLAKDCAVLSHHSLEYAGNLRFDTLGASSLLSH